MSRKLSVLAMVAASITLVFGALEADAKGCRSRHRDHDCCHHHRHHDRDCGHHRVNDCGHQQHYQHVSTATCCAPRATCCHVQPSCAMPAVSASCATPYAAGSRENAPAPGRATEPAPAPVPAN